MKKILMLLICSFMLVGCTEEPVEDLLGISYETEENVVELEGYENTNPVVAMYIEGYGSIVMELYPNIAPNTVNNFIELVESGFYDDNTFHRLDKSFVLQGGDPTGTGTGGPDHSIKGEFTSNGFKNDLKHEKGVVSMARSMDNDSAGSQFFIMLEDASSLDENYAAFGRIIDGSTNIDNIVKNENVSDLTTGKLTNNLVLKKTVVDLNDYITEEVEKIEK